MDTPIDNGVLANATNELADLIGEKVGKVEAGWKECKDLLQFLHFKNPDGLFSLVEIIPAYAKAMTRVGVKTKSDLVNLWQSRLGDPSVAESVKKLHDAEERYAAVVKEIEARLIIMENSIIGESASLGVGDCFPKGLALTNVSTGDNVELGSAWSDSSLTLFVFTRHYG